MYHFIFLDILSSTGKSNFEIIFITKCQYKVLLLFSLAC